MASTSPSTVPPNRRRDKAQLSCSFCRQKKLRCDRQRPCQTCVARGVDSTCTYATRSVVPPKTASSRGSTVSSSLLKRLNSLEDSLMSLTHGGGDPESELVATAGNLSKVETSSGVSATLNSPPCLESGSMHRTSTGTVYVNSAHWKSILDSISELKDCLGADGRRDETPDQPHQIDQPPDLPHREPRPTGGPRLLSGFNRIPTKAELLSAMPDRSVVDRHVFWYFNRLPMIYIHRGSFLRKYEAFWANPSEVSIMWLSILYSIMSMTPLRDVTSGTTSPDGSPDEPGTLQPMYIDQVVQCLILGDYSRGGPYTIEALHHYFVLEHFRRRDAEVRTWSLFGLILRLAHQMGYHREPSRFPAITPFEGEVRRRLWMLLYSIDIMISMQMGMPRLIRDEQCDTQPPRNLLDSDFDEVTEVLPAPRPDVEMTPVLHWQGKHKMMVVMARIADMSLSTAEEDPCSSPSIKQVDTLLRTTYSQLPDGIKCTSLSCCLGSSPEDIGQRVVLAVMLQKGLMILHRRHVVGIGPSKDSFSALKPKCDTACIAESARTCIDAAMELLEYQDFMYRESRDGGALASLGWRLSSSPIAHEFLTATSLLCTYLYRVYRGDPDVTDAYPERIQAIEKALSRTYEIWRSQSNSSRDAKRVTDTLGMLMGKMGDHGVSGAQADATNVPIDHLMAAPWFGGEGTAMDAGLGLYAGGLDEFGSILSW